MYWCLLPYQIFRIGQYFTFSFMFSDINIMFVFWVWTCAADLDQYTGPIKILKKWNKFQEISFYTSLPKIMIVCYAVPEICCVIDSYLFWAIFSTFTPLTAWKIKIEKKKTPGDIIILHKCTKNHDYMLYCSWDMARDRCNCYFSFWAIFCPFTPLTVQKIKF